MLEEQKKCSTPACRDDVRARYAELDEQRNQELAATCQQDITSCETLSAQLQADAPKIQALADKLRRSGDGNTASVIGWLVPGSNQMAQDIITSSIVAQRDGPAASAMATGAQIIASGVGGVKPGVSVGAKSNSSSAILGNKTVAQFEKSLSTLPPGERVAQIKAVVASVTIANGMVKDSKLSRLNGRDVYRANDGNLYAVDTQHGRFEVINSKNGKHLGEVDFDFKQTKPADKSGGHDLKVK
ncbi:filamentous hemagglutinin [Pseudomonas indica]|uniref:Filamentous hemagglutinin n=5 Tax=Pseudomonas indica TaxID=137658 RepID=A0A1G9JL82_9PSED|nr:filamentous hemagglutinin [Pseudomonas indica]